MKIDLIRLIYNQISKIDLDERVEFEPTQYANTPIISLKDVNVKGEIKKNAAEQIEVDLELKGTMILEDAMTLDEINYPFSSKIDYIISENDEKFTNILDIKPILWENIVLEVPIRVKSNKIPKVVKGNGWELKEN